MSRHGPAWSVRFVCTGGHDQHPSRELGVIFRRKEDPDLLTELLANHGEDAGRRLYEAGMIGNSHDREPRSDRPFPNTEPLEDDPTGSIETRWRLQCPTCGLDEMFSGERMRLVIGKLRDAGLSQVDLSVLTRMLF